MKILVTQVKFGSMLIITIIMVLSTVKKIFTRKIGQNFMILLIQKM